MAEDHPKSASTGAATRAEPDSSSGDDLSFLQDLAGAPAVPPTPEHLWGAGGALPQTLGHYRIEGELGRGGMGLVCRAIDANLGRPVALKLLPKVEGGENAVRRFRHEAKTASSLNHPHIVSIYEIGEAPLADGPVHFIAMELVEGQTLRDWQAKEKPSLPRQLSILCQVAAGLAKAHGAGIVHRDLKPANIMVTRDGFAKLLDFGLAKLVGPRLGDGSDPDAPVTRTGTVVGTAAYMSPEQILGKPLDHRADIFSLGAVVFEAVTGQRPFQGTNHVEVTYQILHAETPRVRSVKPDLPEELERIVQRCLAKDPEDRYHSAADLGLDLEQLRRRIGDPSSDSGGGPVPPSGGIRGPTAPRRRLGLLAGALLLATAVVLAWMIPQRNQDGAGPGAVLAPMRSTRLTFSGKTVAVSMSPDGKVVALVVADRGRQSVWVKQVVTGSSVQIAAPAPGRILEGPTISPDGNYVYYTRKPPSALIGKLYRVPILGGPPRELASDVDTRAAPSPDGTRLAYVRHFPMESNSGVFTARHDGSDERRIATYGFEARLALPAWSPDGKSIALAAATSSRARWRLLSFSLAGGAPRSLSTHRWVEISGLAWLADGRGLVVAASDQRSRFNQIWQVAQPSGVAKRITNDANPYRGVSLSGDGSILATVVANNRASLWVATAAKGWRAEQWTADARSFAGVSWSPRGEIFYSALHSGAWDIWVLERRGAAPRRLTSDAGSNANPAVSPDGESVAFQSDRGGRGAIWLMDRDGGRQRRLTTGPIGPGRPSFTPDGRWVVFTSQHLGKETISRISVIDGRVVPITTTYSNRAVVSPDGKRFASGYWDGKYLSPWVIGVLPIGGGRPEHTFRMPTGWRSDISWTPDGSGLSLVNSPRGISNIYVIALDGKRPRQLTKLQTGQIFSFGWHPREEKIVMVRGTVTQDALLIRNWRAGEGAPPAGGGADGAHSP